MNRIYDFTELQTLQKQLKINRISGVIVTVIVFLIVCLLSFFRTDANHRLFLIINIIISLVYGWALISFYIFIIKNIKSKIAFYRIIINSDKEMLCGEIINVNKVPLTLAERCFYELYLKENNQERLVYWETQHYLESLKVGMKVKAEVANNIVIAYEVNHEPV